MSAASGGTAMREPAFWWREAGAAAGLLAPIAAAYGAVAGRRLKLPGRRAGVPVVCIGNLTVGGAGKTPAALAVARMLIAAGERPVLLSRGYGGNLAGPLKVDPSRHRASEVGDEPLLLARTATTIVARDRVKGATTALAAGASVIVMDDGFQNPSLCKDLSVLVVDARRGIGNGRVLPAGPLRAPLDAQLERTDALIVVGSAASAVTADADAQHIPVFRARLVAGEESIAALRGGRVLAFAGIGDPDKFFATLKDAGIAVVATRSFSDHHVYTRAEERTLCDHADREGLTLVTTEKDLARLSGIDEAAELAARAHALPVTLAFDDAGAFERLLREKLTGQPLA
jgi:tetraacyldisaccharide 4'-kinase